MKTPKFDGSTNLEDALNILPPEDQEIFDELDDEMEDMGDLVPYDDNKDLVPAEDVDVNTLPAVGGIDTEIKDDIQQIYDAAMDAFEDQADSILSLEPKMQPRAMEVNRMYLDTALAAVNAKQKQKEHSDKMAIQVAKMGQGGLGSQSAGTINNNIFVGDRNEALKLAKEARAQKKTEKEVKNDDAIDGEVETKE